MRISIQVFGHPPGVLKLVVFRVVTKTQSKGLDRGDQSSRAASEPPPGLSQSRRSDAYGNPQPAETDGFFQMF